MTLGLYVFHGVLMLYCLSADEQDIRQNEPVTSSLPQRPETVSTNIYPSIYIELTLVKTCGS
jgi:hypothetical protein